MDTFIRDQDVEEFCAQVEQRFSESTLCRLLESSGDSRLRRSAVLALGMVGTLESNVVVADALHDEDEVVRQWAETALWTLWFRASDETHTAELQMISALIPHDPKRAVARATALIAQAPEFAEAYNQRAISYWRLGMWDASINDCQQVLSLNPQHFGAASGLGQCYLEKQDGLRALQAFEKALAINPNLNDISKLVKEMREE